MLGHRSLAIQASAPSVQQIRSSWPWYTVTGTPGRQAGQGLSSLAVRMAHLAGHPHAVEYLRTFRQQLVDRADDIYHEVAPQMLEDLICLAAPCDMICKAATTWHCMAYSRRVVPQEYSTSGCISMQVVDCRVYTWHNWLQSRPRLVVHPVHQAAWVMAA
jgi:hypothetical protein